MTRAPIKLLDLNDKICENIVIHLRFI